MKSKGVSKIDSSIYSCTGSLAAEEAKLQNRPMSLNPFTMYRHYRAERIFHGAAKAFYRDTKVD